MSVSRIVLVALGVVVGFMTPRMLNVQTPDNHTGDAHHHGTRGTAAVATGTVDVTPPGGDDELVKWQTVQPLPFNLQPLEELRKPSKPLYVLAEEATPEWRKHKNLIPSNRRAGDAVADSFQLPQSILHKPNPKLADRNTGYIMVAVLSCW